jgi:hypothetical protein
MRTTGRSVEQDTTSSGTLWPILLHPIPTFPALKRQLQVLLILLNTEVPQELSLARSQVDHGPAVHDAFIVTGHSNNGTNTSSNQQQQPMSSSSPSPFLKRYCYLHHHLNHVHTGRTRTHQLFQAWPALRSRGQHALSETSGTSARILAFVRHKPLRKSNRQAAAINP